MADGSWRFGIAEGVVTVRPDAVSIRTTPTAYLKGQYARFRSGSPFQRLRSLLGLCAFTFTPVALALQFHRLFGAERWASVLFAVLGLVTLVWGFWTTHLRETTLPLSTIEFVSIDDSARTVRIVHDRPNGLLSALVGNATRERYALRGAEDVRKAREAFGLRGIDLKRPSDLESDTEYRFTSREGVCFCDQCDSQVSPSDRTCPSCEFRLRVETSPVE